MSKPLENVHKSRVFGLDLLRCIAILLVLVTHTFPLILNSVIGHIILADTSLISVELFFILSGFLIGTIIIKEINKSEYLDFKAIKHFWIRRWFRTLPNYYLVILYYNIVHYASFHGLIFSFHNNTRYLFFFQNFITPAPEGLFGPSWSLSIEEWFYLLFPLIVLAMQFVVKNKVKGLLFAILLFIIIPLLIRMGFALTNAPIDFNDGYRKIVPLRLDGIAYGILLSYIKFYKPQLLKHANTMFMIGLIICIGCLLYSDFFYNFFNNVFLIPIINIGGLLLIPFLEKLKKPKNIILISVTFISIISYSIYLLNQLVMLLVEVILKKFHLVMPPIVIVFIIFTITIVASYIQYTFFEKKVTAIRELL